MEKYPMSLYKDADRNADHRIVADQEAENAARAEGYRMIGEPAPEKKAKGKKDE